MFSFLESKNQDAFEQRRRQQEVWKCIRRVVDTTTDRGTAPESESRAEHRHHRCLPALLLPWRDERPTMEKPVYAITKDFSDNGVSLLSPRRFAAPQVICCLWVDGPVFLLGEIRRVDAFGGGFWDVGVQLLEVINANDMEPIMPLAAKLVPTKTTDV